MKWNTRAGNNREREEKYKKGEKRKQYEKRRERGERKKGEIEGEKES